MSSHCKDVKIYGMTNAHQIEKNEKKNPIYYAFLMSCPFQHRHINAPVNFVKNFIPFRHHLMISKDNHDTVFILTSSSFSRCLNQFEMTLTDNQHLISPDISFNLPLHFLFPFLRNLKKMSYESMTLCKPCWNFDLCSDKSRITNI